jgi:hypothetical protein
MADDRERFVNVARVAGLLLSTMAVLTKHNHVVKFMLLHLCPFNDVLYVKRFSRLANCAAIARLNHQVSLKGSRDRRSGIAHQT